MKYKDKLRTNPLTKNFYQYLRKVKRKRDLHNKLSYRGTFHNRAHNCENLLIILAGYKEFLYPAVFGRIERYAMNNMDICVISSGLYSEALDKICEKNQWSYLSTKQNNVSLVQNVAISMHPKAKYIFKLDEDIFVTEHYFENMLRAYRHAADSKYLPGVMAPILPINGYGHMRILEKLQLENIYAEKFETPKYAAGVKRQIENNPETAKFFWGEGNFVPTIDELNKRFSLEPLEERACPIRFSIGAILFERNLWEDMGYFKVNRSNNAMGADEEQICSYCCVNSRPMMVSENVVVGHLSFGTQNAQMKEYFKENMKLFIV